MTDNAGFKTPKVGDTFVIPMEDMEDDVDPQVKIITEVGEYDEDDDCWNVFSQSDLWTWIYWDDDEEVWVEL